jgi:hypothetical protein
VGLSSLPFSPRIVGAVVVAVVALLGGVLHLRGSSVNVTIGAGPINQARDVAVQADLRTTATALETYFTTHLNYAVPGMRLGVTPSAGDQVEVKATATGYCIRGKSLSPTANPLDYTWYDSQAGGLQPGTGPISPSTGASAVCAGGGLFLPVH